MAKTLAVARYLIWLAQAEAEPDFLTHMRLQKLLYYVQGWSLATRGKQLFDARFEAWRHGPVVRSIYPHFADYRDEPIAASEAGSKIELNDDDKLFVASVWSHYREFSASALRDMTHREPPWIEARRGLPDDANSENVIPVESIQCHFTREFEKHRYPGATPESLEQGRKELHSGRVVSLDALLSSHE